MVSVRGELFHPAAAAALQHLENQFAAQFGSEFIITSGYRPLGSPSDPPNSTGRTQWGSWNWYRKYGSPLAAIPGKSNHGWGLAADLGSGIDTAGTPQHRWIAANAPATGWVTGRVAGEPWHVEYDGSLTAPPTTEIPEGIAMSFSIVPAADKDGGIWLVPLNGGHRVRIGDPYHVELLQRLKANTGSDQMLLAEVDIALSYITAAHS
ncbi:M15 family metallopeptidase [Gryllotalpicola protaetiae]|nr:M15 family metallopeptidase [Gryllotalpicola protaetiae]